MICFSPKSISSKYARIILSTKIATRNCSVMSKIDWGALQNIYIQAIHQMGVIAQSQVLRGSSHQKNKLAHREPIPHFPSTQAPFCTT